MTKTTGHIVIGIFDVLTILALYWVYLEHTQVVTSIDSAAGIVNFNSKIYWALGMVLVPFVHFIAVIEAFWPRTLFKKITKPANITMSIYLLTIFILPFILSNKFERNLLANGYVFCDAESFYGTVSSTLVFVKSRELCNEDIRI